MFRYKRLIFGINAAAEMFQDVIASAISDIPSVKNISDDVIIYGANRMEHNKTLHAVQTRVKKLNSAQRYQPFLDWSSVVEECLLIPQR